MLRLNDVKIWVRRILYTSSADGRETLAKTLRCVKTGQTLGIYQYIDYIEYKSLGCVFHVSCFMFEAYKQPAMNWGMFSSFKF